MDELSSLLEQFRFHERWRGYDPNEVDAYVAKVIRVVSGVQDQLRDLQTKLNEPAASKTQPFSDLRSATPATPTNVDVNNAAHGIAKTLELAQNAADEAIADAYQQAEKMVVEANTRREQADKEAAELVATAKTEAKKIRQEANDHATRTLAEAHSKSLEHNEALVLATRDELAEQCEDLSAQRDLLANDVALLNQHLTAQRHEIQRSLAVLSSLLTSPELFRLESMPELQIQETDASEDEQDTLDAPVENLQEDKIEPTSVADIAEQQPRLVTRADLVELDEVQPSDPPHKPKEEPILAQLRETASRDQIAAEESEAASDFFNEDEEQKSRSWFLGRR